MGVQEHWSITAANNDQADTTINFRENQAPSTLNDSMRALMAAVKMWVKGGQGVNLTAGSATAYTLTTGESFGSLVDGMRVTARMHVASGLNPTLNVDGRGAVAIRVIAGAGAPPQGALVLNGIFSFTYVASVPAWVVSQAQGVSGRFVGEVFDFAGSVAPTFTVLCAGQAINRTTFAQLFAVIGTTYGAGDGSTTFNVPDCRGRVTAAPDNMGGTPANRLTAQPGGINGALASVGGGETHVLTIAQLAAHDHPANVTDPGHLH